MSNKMIEILRSGLLSILRCKEVYHFTTKHEVSLIEYFAQIEEDLNTAFNNFKSKYERD